MFNPKLTIPSAPAQATEASGSKEETADVATQERREGDVQREQQKQAPPQLSQAVLESSANTLRRLVRSLCSVIC